MPKALLLENIHPDAAKSLRDRGFEAETMKGALSEDELIDAYWMAWTWWAYAPRPTSQPACWMRVLR